MQEYVTELRDLMNKANAKGYAINDRDFAVALEKGAISEEIRRQMTVMKAQNSTIEEMMRVAISMANSWEQKRQTREQHQRRPDKIEPQYSRDQRQKEMTAGHQSNAHTRSNSSYEPREFQRMYGGDFLSLSNPGPFKIDTNFFKLYS